jgi:hypothetical protein
MIRVSLPFFLQITLILDAASLVLHLTSEEEEIVVHVEPIKGVSYGEAKELEGTISDDVIFEIKDRYMFPLGRSRV